MTRKVTLSALSGIKLIEPGDNLGAITIAALQAGDQEKSSAFTGWYSDLGALTYGIATASDGVANATNGRRSATARTRPREIPRRDDGPISLEPPQ